MQHRAATARTAFVLVGEIDSKAPKPAADAGVFRDEEQVRVHSIELQDAELSLRISIDCASCGVPTSRVPVVPIRPPLKRSFI